MIDTATIDRQLTLLRRYAGYLKDLQATSQAEYEKNAVIRGSVERYLQLAIECCLNIGNHIISAEGLERPEDYAAIGTTLGIAGILPQESAARLSDMARFRNRLVHIYWTIDNAEVYSILQTRLGDFEDFARHIVNYVEGASS